MKQGFLEVHRIIDMNEFLEEHPGCWIESWHPVKHKDGEIWYAFEYRVSLDRKKEASQR